jgi:hypothetical protein
VDRRYYLSLRTLPAPYYPARVVRNDQVTLHVVDPRASRFDALAASMDLLEPWEHEVARAGYGQPPPGFPLLDELLDGMVMPFVPTAIRVPGEPAIQYPITSTPAYRTAYGQAIAWAIAERWGNAETYRHPLPVKRRGAAA